MGRQASAIRLQARWRSHVARTALRRHVAAVRYLEYLLATKIQAQWRRYAAQRRYLNDTAAFRRLQTSYFGPRSWYSGGTARHGAALSSARVDP